MPISSDFELRPFSNCPTFDRVMKDVIFQSPEWKQRVNETRDFMTVSSLLAMYKSYLTSMFTNLRAVLEWDFQYHVRTRLHME